MPIDQATEARIAARETYRNSPAGKAEHAAALASAAAAQRLTPQAPSSGLSDVDRRVCELVGVSEAAFLAERQREASSTAPPPAAELTADDRAVMRALGLTDEASFLAEKARNAALDAKENS